MAGIEDSVNKWLKNPWMLAHRPFKVMENIYFVGTSWVSAFLLDTDEGLVLIDCAMQETVYLLVDSIHQLGFNPHKIKKLLLTHGHFDHCGAVRALQEISGCEVWVGKDEELFFTERRDLIAFEDHVPEFRIDHFYDYGSSIDLGNLVLHPVLCPGHTPRTTSFFFAVEHNGEKLVCATHGGLGAGVLTKPMMEQLKIPSEMRLRYLDSIEKVIDCHVDVVLPSHAGHCMEHDFFKLADEDDGTGNGFVNAQAWRKMLQSKREQIEQMILDDK